MTQAFLRSTNTVKAIALAGLCAGTLDIADAIIFYGVRGVPAMRILQGIAYGLIGRPAYVQGIRSALLGLLLHFVIATSFATIYILASRRLRLSRHPLLYGMMYGVAIYAVMNYIVLPLSHIGLRPLPPPAALVNGVLALIVCVGIPIAFIARHFDKAAED